MRVHILHWLQLGFPRANRGACIVLGQAAPPHLCRLARSPELSLPIFLTTFPPCSGQPGRQPPRRQELCAVEPAAAAGACAAFAAMHVWHGVRGKLAARCCARQMAPASPHPSQLLLSFLTPAAAVGRAWRQCGFPDGGAPLKAGGAAAAAAGAQPSGGRGCVVGEGRFACGAS